MRRPVNAPYTITTEFGVPDSNALFRYHSGVDYGVPTGREIYAPVSGRVTYAQFHSVRGNMVGIFDGTNTHRLMHNSRFAVSPGQQVTEGQVVAYAGTTGLSTGPHCHWDIIRGDKMDATSWNDFIDPASLLFATPAPAPVPEVPAQQAEVLQGFQRRVGSAGVNHREGPNTSAAIRKEWAAGEVLDFKGYVIGENYSGNDKWFVGKWSGGFMWSGSFNDPSTANLPDLTAELFPKKEEPKPVEIPPSYETILQQLTCVTGTVSPHVTNYEKGNFPANPTGVVIHDFGTDGKDTLQSSINHFRNANTTAPHFIVSGRQILQSGQLEWRMYHAGPNGNDKIGIEVDPDVDTNPATAESLKTLLRQLDEKFGKLLRFEHNQFMNTLCGDDVKAEEFSLATMYPEPKPELPPEPHTPIQEPSKPETGTPTPSEPTTPQNGSVEQNPDLTEAFYRFLDQLKKYFKK